MGFYHRHYTPDNAILSVVGNISFDEVVRLSEKWFGPIKKGKYAATRTEALPHSTCTESFHEPLQTRIRRRTVYRNVPSDMLVMAFHMGDRKSKEYHVCDLITDILAAGQSSRLIQHLIHRDRLLTSVDAYIQGSLDTGLLNIMGRLAEGITCKEAEDALWSELKRLKTTHIPSEEFNKVRNRSESERTFNNINYLNHAINLAQMELIGQDNSLTDELNRYCSVTAEDVKQVANRIFLKKNCSVLYYKRKK